MLELAYIACLDWLVRSTRRYRETEYDRLQRAADGAAAQELAKHRSREHRAHGAGGVR